MNCTKTQRIFDSIKAKREQSARRFDGPYPTSVESPPQSQGVSHRKFSQLQSPTNSKAEVVPLSSRFETTRVNKRTKAYGPVVSAFNNTLTEAHKRLQVQFMHPDDQPTLTLKPELLIRNEINFSDEYPRGAKEQIVKFVDETQLRMRRKPDPTFIKDKFRQTSKID